MSTSRRKFLKTGTLVAVATAVPLNVLASNSPASMVSNFLASGSSSVDSGFSAEMFSRYLNTQFLLSKDNSELAATLVEVRHWSTDKSVKKNGKECFSLMFENSDGRIMRQNTYKATHASLGQFDLFVVPKGRKKTKAAVHEALFNSLH